MPGVRSQGKKMSGNMILECSTASERMLVGKGFQQVLSTFQLHIPWAPGGISEEHGVKDSGWPREWGVQDCPQSMASGVVASSASLWRKPIGVSASANLGTGATKNTNRGKSSPAATATPHYRRLWFLLVPLITLCLKKVLTCEPFLYSLIPAKIVVIYRD